MDGKQALAGSARLMSDVVGQLTRDRRALPSFLICGAQRAGTTSMFRALVQHPNVVGPALRKGVHYFDLAAERPLSWYRAHFPLQATLDRVARRTGSSAITGESSPYYLWHPLAGARIAAALPSVRLLVLVRDPVERAYSAHAHELARGFESEPFEKAIRLEQARLDGRTARVRAGERDEVHQHQAYLARSNYAPQLDSLANAVGRERVHVVDSGDFFAEPEPVWEAVCSFLGLPPCSAVRFERHNARSRAPLDPALRRDLDERFVESDTELARWLGHTPSWRR